ncbi:MAG: ribosome silencing factor [Sandaracinaceae bacterium]|nr:ribosome silencing factor [Sandaracinaceae bacterium]
MEELAQAPESRESKGDRRPKSGRRRRAGDQAAKKRSRELAFAVAEAALEKKASNVLIIELVGKASYTDYLVIMSGHSDRQVSSIAEGIVEEVEKKCGLRCLSVEGLPNAKWVLVDWGDVIAHVFHEDVRAYYALESLWLDANQVKVGEGFKVDEGFKLQGGTAQS